MACMTAAAASQTCHMYVYTATFRIHRATLLNPKLVETTRSAARAKNTVVVAIEFNGDRYNDVALL